jgi:hypothetical protein
MEHCDVVSRRDEYAALGIAHYDLDTAGLAVERDAWAAETSVLFVARNAVQVPNSDSSSGH